MENDHLVERNQRTTKRTFPAAYNEAIPNTLDIIDALEIDVRGFEFANKWITALLSQRPTSFQIIPPKAAERKVAHLFFNARNTERIKGYKNLAFGYPILAKKDGAASIGFSSMPIFLWDIHLEPSAQKINHWLINKKEPTRVSINPLLANVGEEIAGLVEKYAKRIEKRGVNKDLCIAFSEELAIHFNFYNEPPKFSIEKFPDIVDLATVQQEGSIVWSGVFSAFPPVNFYSLSDSILSKEYWQQALRTTNKRNFQFCYLPCDHQQKLAHVATTKNRFVLIEGAAGSGKKHSISNLIIGNLLAGERTIIISQSLSSLEQITQKIAKEGFGDLAFLFRNIDLDKDNLVDNIIAKTSKGVKNGSDLSNDFLLTYQRYDKFRTNLEQTATGYSKSVFDINNWTQTVGLYLKNSRSEGKELLDTQLQINDFTFDFLEYEQLKDKIERSEALFSELFAFYHPLNDVGDNNFEKENVRVAKNELVSNLNILQNKTQKIQRQYYQKVGLYKDDLEEYYEKYFLELKNQTDLTQDTVDQLQLQFGHEYDKTSVGNLKILKAFSDKSKTALALKNKIIQQFEALKAAYFEQPYFDFEFLEAAAAGNIGLIKEQLDSFENTLQSWRIRNQVSIQENIKHLNSKTVNADMKSAQKIGELESEIANLIIEINDSQIFKKRFQDNAMTLHLKQQLLDEVAEKLSRTVFNLRDFEQFYEWRQLSAEFSKKEENVIKALIKVRPEKWLTTFDAWYYHNLLTKQSRQNANFEPLLNSYLSHHDSLIKKVPNYLIGNWQKKRIDTISATKKKGKSTLNSFLKKSKDIPAFSKYFKVHLTRITNLYPVVLMTAEMAKSLLGSQEKACFDSLIIQDGANYTKEEGGNLLNLAKKVQVFGTSKGMMLNRPNSFWNLARSLAGKHVLLKSQHRKQAKELSAFNNVAFDQQLEVSLSDQITDAAIAIFDIDGDYDEALRTNEAECRHMLSLLTNIKGTPQNTYPKVGFVCATIEQRNLFANYLLQIKQTKGNGVDKIMHLERNGMGVYSLGELNGQEFDILICSLTFGTIDASGEMTKDLTQINTPVGINEIQQLLTSGLQKIMVCHSFSTAFIQEQVNNGKKDTWSILANYLAFGKAIQHQDIPAAQEVINRLSANITKPKIEEKAVFLDEVAQYLAAYFKPDEILTNQLIKGNNYPLIIKGKPDKNIQYVIQADSFFNNADAFSFVWQNQANQSLEAEGYRFISIWSRDWWRQPEAEARKLASKIIRLDGEV